MNNDFNYEIKDKIVLIKILSNLDYTKEYDFEKLLEDFIFNNFSIIFDFTEVEFINSSVIGLIVRKTRFIKCVIVLKNNNLKKVLDIVNFDKVIPIVNTTEEAIDILKDKLI
jgi:anti-anti-sigma factor